MPTVWPRHSVIETDEISHALDTARRVWPELSDKPTELLRRLILAGVRSIDDRAARRRRAVDTTAGSLAGTFAPGYLDDVRQDWPE